MFGSFQKQEEVKVIVRIGATQVNGKWATTETSPYLEHISRITSTLGTQGIFHASWWLLCELDACLMCRKGTKKYFLIDHAGSNVGEYLSAEEMTIVGKQMMAIVNFSKLHVTRYIFTQPLCFCMSSNIDVSLWCAITYYLIHQVVHHNWPRSLRHFIQEMSIKAKISSR